MEVRSHSLVVEGSNPGTIYWMVVSDIVSDVSDYYYKIMKLL
jgi:hypothetical protein